MGHPCHVLPVILTDITISHNDLLAAKLIAFIGVGAISKIRAGKFF